MTNRALIGWLFLYTMSYAHHYDVLVLGDDVSVDIRSHTEKNWIDITREQCRCSPHIHNLSEKGATISQGLLALESFYHKHSANIVVLELGHNDAQHNDPITHLQRNLDKLVSLAETHSTHIILVATDLPPQYGTIYRQMLKTTFERVAHNHGITLINTDYANNPDLVQQDGIHPNNKGHQYIAELITPHLEQHACHL